jgi:hypothetical protein
MRVKKSAASGPRRIERDAAAHTSRPPRARGHWRGAAIAVAGLVLGSAACTLLLDETSTQCQVDADCAKFGGHPFCQNKVCVKSGLAPADCFSGTPQQPSDFLNQCSVNACLSFDDCARLKQCSAPGPDLVKPPPPDSGAPGSSGGAGDGGGMPSCLDPTNGRASVVYITGSSNFPPLLTKLAPIILAGGGPTPVFQVTNSCTGVKSVFNSVPIKDPPAGSAASKYAAYFGPDGSQIPCTLGMGGAPVDIGESDIFSSTCDGFGAPGNSVSDSLGPIQAMAFVVPGASQQAAISAEAAREVFGMAGNNGAASPWTNPSRYFVRNANTGTQQMIGHAIGVPAGQFWGTDQGTASSVDETLKVLTDPGEAEAAIGIISVDWYDSDRKNVKALAFKAQGQECAYLPDSTVNSTDKRNVRDGHYPIWGPLHFFTSNPPSMNAAAFLSVVIVPRTDQGVLDAYIGASLVPTCAMTVERKPDATGAVAELGPLESYMAPFQCGCYFESKKGTLPPECMPCATSSDCAGTGRPACNLNFCERQ